MSSYDAWLERPYQEMMEESDHFYDWAEEQGYDLEDPDQLKDAEEDYLDYIEAANEERDVAAYEAHLDRLEMEAEEREYDEGW
jgi:hypothetical protein